MVEKRESLGIWETFLKVHSNVSLISSRTAWYRIVELHNGIATVFSGHKAVRPLGINSLNWVNHEAILVFGTIGLVVNTDIAAIRVYCLPAAVAGASHDEWLATHRSATPLLSRPDRQTLRADFWGVGGFAPCIAVFILNNNNNKNWIMQMKRWLLAVGRSKVFRMCNCLTLQWKVYSSRPGAVLRSLTYQFVIQ